MNSIQKILRAPLHEQRNEIRLICEKGKSNSYFSCYVQAPLQALTTISLVIKDIPHQPLRGLGISATHLTSFSLKNSAKALLTGISIGVRSLVQVAVLVTAVTLGFLSPNFIYKQLDKLNKDENDLAEQVLKLEQSLKITQDLYTQELQKISQLQSQLEKKEGDIVDFETKMKDSVLVIKICEESIIQLKLEIQTKEKENFLQKNQFEMNSKDVDKVDIKAFTDNSIDSIDGSESLKQQLDELKNTLNESERKLQEMQTESQIKLESLELKLQETKENQLKLKNQICEKDIDLNFYKDQFNLTESDLAVERNKYLNLLVDLDFQKKQNQNLRNFRVSEGAQMLELQNKSLEDNGQASKTIETLSSEIAKKDANLNELLEKISQNETEKEKLNTELFDLTQEKLQIGIDKKGIEDSVSNLKDEVSTLKSQNEEREKILKDLQVQIEERDIKIASLQDKSLVENEQAVASRELLLKEIEKKELSLQEFEKQISALGFEKAKLENELSTLWQEKVQTQTEEKAVSSEVSDLKAQLEVSRSQKREIEKSFQDKVTEQSEKLIEIINLKNELKTIHSEHETKLKQKKLSWIEKATNSIKAEVHEKTEKINALTKENVITKDSLEKTNKHLTSSQELVANAKKLSDKNTNLNEKNIKLTTENKKLTLENKNLSKKVSELDGEHKKFLAQSEVNKVVDIS